MKTTYDLALYPFQHREITINSNRIHYIDEGKGKTLLFCHPSVSSSFMYRNMIRELSKDFRCVALDFPGFGLSENDHEYQPSINAQAEIIGRFIEALDLKDIYLVMQEIGGHSAMMYFLEHPATLSGLILTDTIVFPCSSYPKIRKMLGFVNGPFFNFLNTNFNFLIRAMTRFGFVKRKLTKKERSTYKAMFSTREKRRYITSMLYELVLQEELLNKIEQSLKTTFNRLPTLVIYGTKDALTEMGVPERVHKMLPNSELHWVEGESHFPHEGAPDELNAIIRGWMDKGNII